MKNKLNNKGYMLIEIILASALAFGLAYFIIDLTIKLKNKNDDLFVTTQIATDTAIVSNELMSYIKNENIKFNCDNIETYGRKITYIDKNGNKNLITEINQYATINGNVSCDRGEDYVKINIPIRISQIPDENFDINVYYEFTKRKELTCENIVNNYSCSNSSAGDSPIFTYTGKCTILDDGDGDWRIKFTSSGTLTMNETIDTDLFMVGAGAGNGGYGGANYLKEGLELSSETSYVVTIGSGSTLSGGATSFGTYSAAGGTSSSGGATGGTCEFRAINSSGGCSYGLSYGHRNASAGTVGQCWGEGGIYNCCKETAGNGAVNTGNNGGISSQMCGAGTGGSGIVIIRNYRN